MPLVIFNTHNPNPNLAKISSEIDLLESLVTTSDCLEIFHNPLHFFLDVEVGAV